VLREVFQSNYQISSIFLPYLLQVSRLAERSRVELPRSEGGKLANSSRRRAVVYLLPAHL
jgi:hypothetical protein